MLAPALLILAPLLLLPWLCLWLWLWLWPLPLPLPPLLPPPPLLLLALLLLALLLLLWLLLLPPPPLLSLLCLLELPDPGFVAAGLTQKLHALHWQREQCFDALASRQKLAQDSYFRSPVKPEEHGTRVTSARTAAAWSPSSSRVSKAPLTILARVGTW